MRVDAQPSLCYCTGAALTGSEAVNIARSRCPSDHMPESAHSSDPDTQSLTQARATGPGGRTRLESISIEKAQVPHVETPISVLQTPLCMHAEYLMDVGRQVNPSSIKSLPPYDNQKWCASLPPTRASRSRLELDASCAKAYTFLTESRPLEPGDVW